MKFQEINERPGMTLPNFGDDTGKAAGEVYDNLSATLGCERNRR